MINFPDTPQTDDTYSEGGKTWKYNGTAWVGVGSTTVTWDNVSGKPTFGTAAYTNSSAYATSTQGAKADSASQPGHQHALSDLTQSGATSGQVPTWNGTAWAPQTPSGGTPAPTNDLDEMFNTASATYYHEINYTAGGDVSAIEVYATSAKTTHLYSRAFTYDGAGNLTQVLTTDQQDAGVSLTKTITYTGSGDIATVTRSYSL